MAGCKCEAAFDALRDAGVGLKIYDALGCMLPEALRTAICALADEYAQWLKTEASIEGVIVKATDAPAGSAHAVRVDGPAGGARFGMLRLTALPVEAEHKFVHAFEGADGARWTWDAAHAGFRGTGATGAPLAQTVVLLGFSAKGDGHDIVLHGDSAKPLHAIGLLSDAIYCGCGVGLHAGEGMIERIKSWRAEMDAHLASTKLPERG